MLTTTLSKQHGVEISDRWIFALADSNTHLNCDKECVGFSDFHGDGDYKLIVADKGAGRYNMYLKVFKGVTFIGESVLVDMPTGILSFSSESQSQSHDAVVPSIAVATGTAVLIFKNLKPFYKYSLPAIEPHQDEVKAWQRFNSGQINGDQLHIILTKIKEMIGMSELSPRSQNYLVVPETDREHFLAQFRDKPVTRPQTITAMTALKRNSSELDTADVFVVATESGNIYIVDPYAYHLLESVAVSSSPVFLVSYGAYEDEYKIAVTTRESEIFVIKRGAVSSKPIISLRSDIVSVCMIKKQLIVACSDHTLSFYSLKGKLYNRLKLDQQIVCIEPFFYTPRQYNGVFVVHQKEIKLYINGNVVDRVKTQSPIRWIKYGRFGREEGGLVIGFLNGALAVSIFRRTADLEETSRAKQMTITQQIRGNYVPKKTKIYVDHTIRERDMAVKMHQIYQRDLFMLKLDTAKTYYRLVSSSGQENVTTKAHDALDLSIDVNGFGPEFILKSSITSRLPMDPAITRCIVYQWDRNIYKISPSMIIMPPLIHTKSYSFASTVTVNRPETFQTEDIKVLVVEKDTPTPLAIAVVTMPASELPMFD
ncbi:hypothetical protein QR680_014732 [Steinernema hermaphroditum]|uniref:Bardet-Biedl syndrome 1 N-terminal domain-containing protein n=1 Tax=Steinernema hermaphroditum TaxID=289476 RepID=A0AA39M4S1_9BILA|nr:hypothetical protein QR680_014732 [Steinernema hermaphroditum]